MLISCRKDAIDVNGEGLHIIIVAGQSNTHYGTGFDADFDSPHPRILQLGRHNGNQLKIIDAVEPLDHHTKISESIGFAMTFAKYYLETYLTETEKIIIIPAGHAGTGFSDNDWNKGDPLFDDLVDRYKHVKELRPGSHLAAILWHQGESDVKNLNYQESLDTFIYDLREELNATNAPLIMGGMNPYWVDQSPERIKLQSILKDTPNRIHRVGYADPSLPIIINKDSNQVNSIHYNAAGLRELGARYFLSYIELH